MLKCACIWVTYLHIFNYTALYHLQLVYLVRALCSNLSSFRCPLPFFIICWIYLQEHRSNNNSFIYNNSLLLAKRECKRNNLGGLCVGGVNFQGWFLGGQNTGSSHGLDLFLSNPKREKKMLEYL